MKKRYIGFLSALCLSAVVLLSGCTEKGLTIEEVAKDPIGYAKAGGAMVSEAWNAGDASELMPLLSSLAESGGGQADFTLELEGSELEGQLAFDASAVFGEMNGTLSIAEKTETDEAQEPDGEKLKSEKKTIKTEAAGEKKSSKSEEETGKDKKAKAEKEIRDLDLMFHLDDTEFLLASELLLGSDDTYGFQLEPFFAQGKASGLAKAIGLTETHMALLEACPELEETWPVLVKTGLEKLETAEAEFWSPFDGMEAEVTEETVTIDDTEVDAIAVTTTMPEAWMQSAEETDGDCVFYLNRETGALMRLDINNASETVEKAILLFGVDPVETQKIGVELHMEREDDETVTFTGSLLKERKDKTDSFDLDLNLALNDGDPVNFGMLLFHNTGTDAYMLQLISTEGDRTQYFFELRGSVFFREDGADLTVHTMKVNDVSVECALEATLTAGAELPEKQPYRDLLNADNAVLETLGQFVDLDWVNDFVSAIRSKFELNIQGHCYKCYKDATTKVTYLGETWLCCKKCAKEITEVQAGSYCDSCWNETEAEDLTVTDIYGVTYRLCPDCYDYMTSY